MQPAFGMASFTKFEEIEAWQTAETIVVLAYGLLKEGPGSKDWALKDQVQRASVSIMCNISEGFESRSALNARLRFRP